MRQQIGISGIGLGVGTIIGHYTGNLWIWVIAGTLIGILVAFQIK